MRIRTLEERDIPGAAALFARAAPANGWPTAVDRERYFREILFNNPWRELDLPSWVAEADGRVVGFYALLPRRMVFRGRMLRVAVGCQIVVDPEPRFALAALQLLQACLRGPQDLTLADGADERSRRMWLGVGGVAPVFYNLQWLRLLRPARFALALLEQHGACPSGVVLAARPVAAVVDGLAARLGWNRCYREPDGLTERDLDASTMLAHLPEFAASALQPWYDAGSFEWVLREAQRKRGLGRWRARVVCDHGRTVGWYAYYLRHGSISEVVQIAARPGAYDTVLRHLFADAWRQRVAALRGRLDPRHIEELSARHCWLRREGACVLVHSRQSDILDAIRRGDAFISRLDGEWCLRFHDG